MTPADDTSYFVVDWLVRDYTPVWLDGAGQYSAARLLRELDPLMTQDVVAYTSGVFDALGSTMAVLVGSVAVPGDNVVDWRKAVDPVIFGLLDQVTPVHRLIQGLTSSVYELATQALLVTVFAAELVALKVAHTTPGQLNDSTIVIRRGLANILLEIAQPLKPVVDEWLHYFELDLEYH